MINSFKRGTSAKTSVTQLSPVSDKIGRNSLNTLMTLAQSKNLTKVVHIRSNSKMTNKLWVDRARSLKVALPLKT